MILDEVHHAGDALSLGRGGARGVRAGAAAAGADRHAVPLRHQPDPVRDLRARTTTACRARSPTTPTATRTRSPTTSSDRCCSWPTAAQMQWRTRAGDEVAARLGEPLTKDLTAQALRTALDPSGAWIPSVLAGRRPAALRGAPARARRRRPGDRDRPGVGPRLRAGARDQVAGEKPTVVLSDEKAASKKIATFADDGSRWMVAVRMVSEGVDVPRLAVGVYATTTSTPLFFAQAVGRFVRARQARGDGLDLRALGAAAARRTPPRWRSSATTCSGARSPTRTTSSPPRTTCSQQAQQAESASSDEELRAVRGARARRRRFDRVLYDGGEFGHEGEVHVGLRGGDGLPRHPRAARARPGARPAPAPAERAGASAYAWPAAATEPREVTTHEQLATMRRELNGLVAAWYHRTGQPHGVTHAALRKECGGPAAAAATAGQLEPADRPAAGVGDARVGRGFTGAVKPSLAVRCNGGSDSLEGSTPPGGPVSRRCRSTRSAPAGRRGGRRAPSSRTGSRRW